MKRHLRMLLLMACLLVPWTMRAQETITIGDGTTTTYVTPFNSLWGYSFVEQIFLADEIGMDGNITSISFFLRESDAAQTNQIDIYMKNVDRESFASTDDYEPVTAGDMVFTGTVTFNPGETTIELDNPFAYEGGNLLVAVHEYTSGYSTRYFYYTEATGKVVSFHSDSADPDPYNLSSYSGNKYVSPNRSNIQLEITPMGDEYCYKPANLTVSDLTAHEATFSWESEVGDYVFEYKPADATDEEWQAFPLSENTITLSNLTSSTVYSARVKAICGGENESGYRTVEFTTLVSCPAPDNLAFDTASITESSFSFSWHPVGEESNWEVRIDGGDWISVNTPSYTATGLTASTNYTVDVRAICGEYDISFLLSGSCRTLCGALNEFPVIEDFENYTNYTCPACWYPVLTRTYSNNTYPYAYNGGSANSHSGIGYLCAYPSTTIPNIIATLNPVELDANMIHVSFAAKLAGTAATTKLQAGLMTDLQDTSTFIPLYTIGGTNGVWVDEDCEFYSDDVDVEGPVYVAFRFLGSANEFLDDVRIEQSSPCRRPVDAVVLNYSYNSIHYGWTMSGSDNNGYLLRVGTTNNVDAESTVEYSTSDTEYLVEELSPNTTYYAWVAADCGDSHTAWTKLPSVTTHLTCYPISGAAATNIGLSTAALTWEFLNTGVPATEVEIDFVPVGGGEEDTLHFTTDGTSLFLTDLQPGTSYTAKLKTHCDEYTATPVTVNFTTAACGEMTGTGTFSYAPLYGLYKYGYSQTLYPASMVSAIDTITGVQFELSSGSTDLPYRYVDVYMGYTTMNEFADNNTYVPISELTQVVFTDTISVGAAGWVNIPFDSVFIPNGSGNLVVAVVNKTGEWKSLTWKGFTEGTAKTCIYWYQDSEEYDLTALGTAKGTSATRPNIRFNGNCDIEQCMASNMVITNTTTESLEVSWVPNGSEEQWVLNYRSLGGEWETVDVSESPYVIDGLNPSSAYEVALGSLCDEDTLYTTTIAYTQCDMVELPYYNDFSADLGPCWSTTTVTHEATGNLKFTAATSQAILPEMQLNDVMVTIGLRGGAATNSIKLGVTSNNGATVQWLDTIQVSSTTDYLPATSTLNGYDGDATRLVLACGPSTTTLYLDYINVSEIPECLPVDNLTVSNISGYGATVNWESPAEEFQISYRIAGQTWTDSIVEGTTCILTGLQPVSNYQVRVRPVCEVDTTFWSQTSFTTPCGYYDSPFLEEFTATTIPSCWDRYTGVYNDHPDLTSTTSGWVLNTASVMDGTRHIKMNIYGTSAKYWLVTPSIAVGENMSLSFDYALTQYNQAVAPTSTDGTDDDRFIVALSTDNGTNWTKLAEWSCDTLNGAFNYLNIGLNDHASIDLADYADQVVRIAFYGESTVTGGDRDLHIDNVLVSVSGCDRPDSAQVSDITFNGAVLSWVDNSSLMTGYEVRYGTYADVDNDTLTSVQVGTTSLTLENLQPATVYHAWVRTLCGEGSNSLWTSFGTFRTPRSCYAPTSYNISSIGYTAITFGWTVDADSAVAGRPITSTILRIVNLSDANVADTVITVSDTNMITVEDLSPNTDYRVYMTTECAPDSSNTTHFNFSTQGCGTIDPGGYTITGVPFHGLYKYGYSQTLYPADALEFMDTIRGISYYVSSVPTSYTTRTVNVYLANTDRVRLDTNSYMPVDSLSLMATNYAMNVSHTGWTTIMFDTFFVWDGTSDILVAVQNVTGQYASFNFRGHQVDTNKNAYWYRDPAIITPENPNAPNGTTMPGRNSSNLVADIRFEGNCNLGTCLPPMLTVDSTTTNAAYITLTAGLEDDTWVVAYRQSGSETWLYDAASTLDHRVINGLSHSTLYEFRGGSVCDGDTLWGAVQEEYTACAPIAVPLVETFDNSLSPCWPHSNLSYYYNASGDLYYKLNDAQSYIATPVLDASIDTLQVRVSWYPTTANKMLRLGTVDADGEDLVWLDSAAVASTSTFTETFLFVTGYTGTTTGRRFVLANAVSTSASNITSITVEPLMACPPIRNAVATSLSQSSAVVDWTDIASAGSWSIEYGVTGFTQGNGTVMNVTSHPATINGLEAMTNYTFYITPNCAASGDNLTISASAMTAMCDDLSIAQNFTNGASSTTTNYSPLGTSLWKYNYIQTIIDSADMAAIDGEISAFGFLPATANKGDYYNHIDVYLANVSDTVLSTSFIHPDSTHVFVKVITDGDMRYTTADWQIHGFDTNFTWDGHSNVLVAVSRQHGEWSSGNSFVAYNLPTNSKKVRYASQDSGPYDINSVSGGTATNTVGAIRLYSCGGFSCPQPVITETEVTSTSIVMNFAGSADSYEVAIMEGDWDEPAETTITQASSFTFSNLEPEHQYTIGVRAVCTNDDDEMTSTWATQTVTTLELLCPAPTAITVESTGMTTATISWTLYDESQTEWQVNVSGMNNFNQDYTATSNTNFQITGLTQGVSYTVKVRAVCDGEPGEWSAPKSFTTTICQPVTNVTVSNITNNSVTVDWTAAEGQSQWEIDYGAQGHPQGSGTSIIVTEKPYTITGLNEYTPYDVYVRTLCDGEGSGWSQQQSFTTLDIHDAFASNVSLYPNPATGSVTISGIEGSASVSIIDMNGRTVFSAEANETLTINLAGYAQGAYYVRISGEQTLAIRKLIVK